MVLRQGLVLGSIGAGAGLILSFLACRALTSGIWILAGHMNYALLPAIAVPLLRNHAARRLCSGAARFADRSHARAAG